MHTDAHNQHVRSPLKSKGSKFRSLTNCCIDTLTSDASPVAHEQRAVTHVEPVHTRASDVESSGGPQQHQLDVAAFQQLHLIVQPQL